MSAHLHLLTDDPDKAPIGRVAGVVTAAWAAARNEAIEAKLKAERDAREHPPIERTPLDDPEALERERVFYGATPEDVQA